MAKQTKWRMACLIMLVIIWGNSMLPGSISGAISNQATGGFYKLFALVFEKLPFELLHSLIRKLAHFGEYMLLGICAVNAVRFNQMKSQRIKAWLFCISCAAIDETIQFFTPNRLAKLSDVLLDSIGALCGIVLVCLIKRWLERRKQAC